MWNFEGNTPDDSCKLAGNEGSGFIPGDVSSTSWS